MAKKFRFTIARKLTLGFGILILAVSTTSYFTYRILDKNLEINQNISGIYAPSATHLNELLFMITNSKMLIKNWVFIDKEPSAPDKQKLIRIHEEEFPKIKETLAPLVEKWEPDDRKHYYSLIASIDSLFLKHQEIMEKLDNFDSYNNSMLVVETSLQVVGNGPVIKLTDRIITQLNQMLAKQQTIVNESNIIMKKSFGNFQDLILLMAVVLFVFMLIIALWLTRTLVTHINYIKLIINKMGSGILPEVSLKRRSDEIGEMADALNVLITGLKQTSEFALKIGEGNFESEFKPLSEYDVLGNSLILMRQNLIHAGNEAELRKIENNQRGWASQGIAEFGELLRKSSDNIEDLSAVIISKLVRYLDASLGGLFIVNDNGENVSLDLTAFFAYDRQKFIKKSILPGENLVGQCYLENETIYLTDIPKDYVHITSGLGGDDPRSLLIVPLKTNEETFGVVELASFKPIEPYQIEFVEKIGESIASTISSVKINIQTAKLLAESNEKSKRLAAQEEEVRKNIQKMQESLDRMREENIYEKEKFRKLEKEHELSIAQFNVDLDQKLTDIKKFKSKFENTIFAINNSIGYYELNHVGEFIYANNKFLKMIDLSFNDLSGKNVNQFFTDEFMQSEDSHLVKRAIIESKPASSLNRYLYNEKNKYFFESFTPVKDEGEFQKFIVLVTDYTEYFEKEQDWNRQLEDAKNEIDILRNR